MLSPLRPPAKLAAHFVHRRATDNDVVAHPDALDCAQSETQSALHALTTRLGALIESSDACVAKAARDAGWRLPREPRELDARTFHRVYFDIRERGRVFETVEYREWRVVETLTATLFCALLRQFRIELARRAESDLRPSSPSAPHTVPLV